MTTFLRISDGTELLNADHITSFKIGHRAGHLSDDVEREHSIGYRVADSLSTSTLLHGFTEDEALEVLTALGKAITRATETGGVIDPQVIADQHVRHPQPA
jgi:hypothetical protein